MDVSGEITQGDVAQTVKILSTINDPRIKPGKTPKAKFLKISMVHVAHKSCSCGSGKRITTTYSMASMKERLALRISEKLIKQPKKPTVIHHQLNFSSWPRAPENIKVRYRYKDINIANMFQSIHRNPNDATFEEGRQLKNQLYEGKSVSCSKFHVIGDR